MRITIDNLDGKEPTDYTSKVAFGAKATIRRAMYQLTLCEFSLMLSERDTLPVREGLVAVADCTGTLIFTGFISEAPSWEFLGEGTYDGVYRVKIAAVSDEAALDAEVSLVGNTLIGQSGDQSWTALAAVPLNEKLPLSLSGQLANAGRIRLAEGTRWSEAAKSVGVGTRSAYKALAQTIQVSSIGQITHSIAGENVGLTFEAINVTDLRWLARDITVIGAEEPKAYVTEVFQGDGVTTTFAMTSKHFVPLRSHVMDLADTFQGTALNPRIWSVSDAAGHVALTAGGLSCLGGTGRDAESTVSSLQQVELGGNIIIEATGVQVGAGSTGTLLSLYMDAVQANQCFAGFQVNSNGTNVSVTPLVQGVVAGATFQIVPGRLYTLRLRLSSPESERVRQSYTYIVDGGTASLGGEVVESLGYLQLEVQDTTSGAASAPFVLYTGAVSTVPPASVLTLLSSGSLVCSIKSVKCVQTGLLQVGLVVGGANAVPQVVGVIAEGGSCKMTASGTLQFYPSNVPPKGSLIFVNYRSRGRAVSRRVLPHLPDGTLPALTQEWVGSISEPAAWSSVDCDRAAAALLQMAGSASAAVKGTYTSTMWSTKADIWPGDMLAIGPLPDGQIADVVVRNVEIAMLGGAPALLEYKVRFANDWAESLSVHISSRIPQDTILPQQPTAIDTALASLSALAIASLTSTSLTVDTGINAPVGGGFEVRRRDETFGPGIDSDLVLRTSARNLTISRSSPVEQFFIRMYDGAVPPNYSLLSAAVFVNVPM